MLHQTEILFDSPGIWIVSCFACGLLMLDSNINGWLMKWNPEQVNRGICVNIFLVNCSLSLFKNGHFCDTDVTVSGKDRAIFKVHLSR